MRGFVLSLLWFAAVAAFAADPKIQTLTATSANGQVSVHLQLTGGFDSEEIARGLKSGVPTSFTYTLEIYRDRPNWFDEGIARSRIEVVATYNSVTREYLLNYRRDRRLVRSETFTDLAALEERMATIDETNLFDIGHRPPYKVKVRAKADVARGWLLYFIPWEVSTRWKAVRVAGTEGP